MGRLVLCIAILAPCAACGRDPPPTAATAQAGNVSPVVLWAPPGSYGGDGGSGGAGGGGGI